MARNLSTPDHRTHRADNSRYWIALALSVFVGLMASVPPGCVGRLARMDAASSLPPAIASIDFSPVSNSSQVLLVLAEDNSQHATAWLLERDQSGGSTPLRVALGPLPACVGANGFAPPGTKREGDRRTPTGAFPLPESYSADPAFVSGLAHRVVTERDEICEDPSSPHYNRWVKMADPNPPAWTPAERDMMELGLIVDYNRDPVVPGAGSGILVHAAAPGPASAGTYGCVGLSKRDLRAVVSRLDAGKRPMVLMGRREFLERPK